MDDEKTVHMVWVTATVTYKLGILATSEDDAMQEARDVANIEFNT